MLVLYERYPGVADPEQMSKLATRICANLALNWRRRKSNPARVEEVPESMPDAPGRDPESVTSAREIQNLLLKAIRESGDRCKRLIRLKLSGVKTREIAGKLRMTTAAVDTAYFRCLQRLRGALGVAK